MRCGSCGAPSKKGNAWNNLALGEVLLLLAAAVLLLLAGCSETKPAGDQGGKAPTPSQVAATPGDAGGKAQTPSPAAATATVGATSTPTQGPSSTPTQAAVSTAGPTTGLATPSGSPTPGATGDLGQASFQVPDAKSLIQTKDWGEVPANQVGIVLKTGLSKTDAEQVAQAMGARVVGEVEYIGLYQLETAGKTEADLRADLEKARASTSVDLAFPLQSAQVYDDVKGVSCDSPGDKTYDGANGIPYKMIGVEAAWQILRASGVELSSMKVGITDDGLYKGKGEFNGRVKFDTPDKEDALVAPLKDGGGENPKGSHGTAVASILAADPENGGITGIASVLGDKLDVSMTNTFDSRYGGRTATKPDPDDPTKWVNGKQSYSIGDLVALKKQVDDGATILNLSWGSDPGSDPSLSKAYRKFFEKMAKDHPDVMFVVAAGNERTAVDGSRYWPAGANLPNMITVGNLDNDGTRWQSSNMAGNDFEVTLGAPGHRVPSGIGPDGKVSNEYGGTSFATPQVTAAAAILRSINPKLSAGEIKKLLVETGGTEVTTSGKTVQVDQSVGGRVLRVDNAVYKAINDLLISQGKKPLDRAALDKAVPLQTVAVGKSPKDYTIQATLGGVLARTADVSIDMKGNGTLGGELKKTVNVPGGATWGFSKFDEADAVTLVVRRLDNGACSRISLKQSQSILGGKWTGSSFITDFTVPGMEGAPPEAMAQMRAVMGIGKPYPFEMVFEEVTPESGNVTASGGSGTNRTTYTFKNGQVTMEYVQTDPVLTRSQLTAQVSDSGGNLVMEGTWIGKADVSGISITVKGTLKAAKVQ